MTRSIMLILILAVGVTMIVFLSIEKTQTPYKSTLTPAFELLGKTPKAINKGLGQAMPVGEMQEMEFGIAIKEKYEYLIDMEDSTYRYLNELIASLSEFSKKDFEYQVYIDESSYPNAYALPGGVIFATRGLLEMVNSEAELVSILGHEMGHIELGHCFDAVKYELLLDQVNAKTLGEIADFCNQVLLRHAYSKTQEGEADDYGYEMLLLTQYDPAAMYRAFAGLHSYYDDSLTIDSLKRANVFRDYFSSHPPTALRINKFKEESDAWWQQNENAIRYNGVKNLVNRESYFITSHEEEWVTNNLMLN